MILYHSVVPCQQSSFSTRLSLRGVLCYKVPVLLNQCGVRGGNKYHTPCRHTKIPISYTRNFARLPNIEEAILLWPCWQQKGVVLLNPWGMNLESLEHTSKAPNKHTVEWERFPSLTGLLCTEVTWCWSLLLRWTLWWVWALCAVSPKFAMSQCIAPQGIGHEDTDNALGQVTVVWRKARVTILQPHNTHF